MNNLKQKSINGFSWTILRLFTIQLSGFIVQLILARVLLPEIFGLVAMMQLFISLGQTLLDGGMTSSLIRSKDVDNNDYSTVFYLNILFSIVLYFIIFFTSGIISHFYRQEILSSILKVYSLSIIIQGFVAVQLARITKEMNFKLQLKLEIPSIVISSSLGIWMAYNDFGVWSIVYMYLIKSLIFAIQVWYFSKWAPALSFSLEKFKKHFYFGYKLTLSSIINTVYDNIYTIIIGRNFSVLQLGFYDRANSLRLVPIQTISTALNNVTYPMFSSIQDNDVELKSTYKKVMQLVIFVVAPLMFLAILNAEQLFRVLLTEKWISSVYYFKILCAASILYPIHAYNLNILNVKGRSDLFLKLEIIKKVIITIALFLTLPFGILGLIYMQLILNVFMFFVNTFYSGKLIKYNSWQQAKDIAPYILVSIFVYFLTMIINNYILLKIVNSDLLLIVINSITFVFFYLSITYFLKLSALKDSIKIVLRNYEIN